MFNIEPYIRSCSLLIWCSGIYYGPPEICRVFALLLPFVVPCDFHFELHFLPQRIRAASIIAAMGAMRAMRAIGWSSCGPS